MAINDTGTSLEAGGTFNGTAGSNATGNVLLNDTDVDAGDTPSLNGSVSAIRTGAIEGSGAAGAVGTGTPAKEGIAASNTVVTYSTELEVSNEDLSLRPGMTATVDIAIVDKTDILVVPNAALRFDPVAAIAIAKPNETKKTLVQSLSPGGGRRWRGTPPPKAGSSDATPKVWTLKDGEPSEIEVTTGITDGRFTEITGGELAAGIPLIISVKPPKTE